MDQRVKLIRCRICEIIFILPSCFCHSLYLLLFFLLYFQTNLYSKLKNCNICFSWDSSHSDPFSNIPKWSFLFLIPWVLLRLSHDLLNHRKTVFHYIFLFFFFKLTGVEISESTFYVSTFLSYFSVICFFYTSFRADHWAQISRSLLHSPAFSPVKPSVYFFISMVPFLYYTIL